jgi:hypothetical protein
MVGEEVQAAALVGFAAVDQSRKEVSGAAAN